MLAIAGKMMLKRRKIPSTLYLGITRDVEKENSLKAYAWLRSGIHILTGNKGLSEPLNNLQWFLFLGTKKNERHFRYF